MKAFAALTALLVLTACGGGGSGSAPQDNTAALAQAAKDAAATYAAQHPAPPAYTGSFVTLSATGVLPTAQGFISGTSEKAVVLYLMNAIVAEPVKYSEWYRALLSGGGITVKLMGDKVGMSAINGLPLYAPDTVYTVKLASNGSLIVSS